MRRLLGRFQTGLNFAGMMGIIVKQLYAVFFPEKFKPAGHKMIAMKRFGNQSIGNAQLTGHGNGGQGVLYVMTARHGKLNFLHFGTVFHHGKGGMAQFIIDDIIGGKICLLV